MARRISTYLIWAVPLALLIGGGLYLHLRDAGGAPAKAETSAPAPRGVPVEAAIVTTGTIVADIAAVGTLQPNEAVVVQPEIAGRIRNFGFAEGARVRKGDLLVELDSDILEAELARARSDLRLASANFERANTLASQGTGTLRARDEARAALDAARANLALAEARLRKATIRAPFSGVVGLRQLSVGEYVGPGTRVVELAEIDPIKVDFRVPEIHLPRIEPEQSVTVTVDALPGETFDGRVYAVHPMVDENGRAIRLRAIIPNPSGRLVPGLFARVRIILETRDRALLVPEAAVFPVKDRTYVYRVVDGRAVLTEVALGLRRPGEVEVVKGLEAGAVVVTAGQQQIRDGAAVRVLSADS